MKLNRYHTAAIASQGATRVEPFFCAQKNPMPRDSDEKIREAARTRSMPLRIQVLRQKIHQLERTPAVDHLVDQIAFTAR